MPSILKNKKVSHSQKKSLAAIAALLQCTVVKTVDSLAEIKSFDFYFDSTKRVFFV
jgi:hypothetical protein